MPDGETVERVEFYLNETRVATLYQPPYAAADRAAQGRGDRLRARRGLPGRRQLHREPGLRQRAGGPGGGRRQLRRALHLGARPPGPAGRGAGAEGLRGPRGRRQAGDRPLRAGRPTCRSTPPWCSTSRPRWRTSLDQARQAALQLLPGDHPAQGPRRGDHLQRPAEPGGEVHQRRAQPWPAGLAGLKAERGTALYDSLIFALYYFNGIKGQRALLLLSDGKDEGSRFTYEDALEYARRAGVTIYTIGLGRGRGQAQAGPARRGDRRPLLLPQERRRAGGHLRHRSRRSCARST